MHELTFERISSIRQWLVENDLDAFIVPHEDEYLGEYIPAHNERLYWATGFTGSAGVAVITQKRAAIFVDGRYTVQVTKQVPESLFEFHHLIEDPFLTWVCSTLPNSSKVGFDPRMHRARWLENAQTSLNGALTLIPVDRNPIDELWLDRPQAILSPVRLMPLDLTGQSSQDKRTIIASKLKSSNLDCAILTQLDSICWLLNIRGLDVSRLPVLLSHAIIHNDSSVDFFISQDRIVEGFDLHVGPDVNVVDPILLQDYLNRLSNKRVLVDPVNTNSWITLTLQNTDAHIVNQDDPCLMIKAEKNSIEVKGMKSCHVRDGAAMVKFLTWLDQQVSTKNWLNEAQLSDQLELFRREDDTLVDLSFDTISAVGSNAAMCHYNHVDQVQPGTLSENSLYLVDSGGQYLDGTTDITRTIAIGTPSAEMKQQFTLVLKGHIALASARFPKGTTGHQLDILARQHLWSYGYDYDHGTGHGVGHFLSVHEGPQRISKAPNTIAMLPGMVVSNEPGYYRENCFGIRIENLELVVQFETDGDMSVLGFESLTRCPIDKRVIESSLLLDHEIHWLNQYHEKVWNDVSPLVEGDTLAWLKSATAPLDHQQ
ncbi:aminopeptidase P family protein [Vibrio sp. WJH972]